MQSLGANEQAKAKENLRTAHTTPKAFERALY
jgi:hypothetical protein